MQREYRWQFRFICFVFLQHMVQVLQIGCECSLNSTVAIALTFCQGEAIAGVIVIGYSVDYVVHLAHMYCEGTHFGHNTRR